MDARTRTAVLWQIYGGIVAMIAIAGAIGELLWWSLYLSDATNVAPFWTRVVHSGAIVSIAAVLVYHSQRDRRNRAMAAAGNAALIEDRGFSFRIGSIPVTIQWMFLLLVACIGFDPENLVRTGAFLIIASAAILIHELGHAIAASRLEQTGIAIHLHALGGTTSFEPGELRTSQQIAVALSGPVAGALPGALALLAGLAAPSFRATPIYRDVLFVTFAWSALNLIPAWPLDGGAVLAALVKRPRVVSFVSIAIALVGLVGSVIARRMELIVFFVVLFAANVLAIRFAATVTASRG